MIRISRPLRLYFSAAGILTLAATALRTAAYFTAFDAKLGYFANAPLPTLAYAVCALVLLLAASFPLVVGKDYTAPAEIPSTLPTMCGAGMAALLMLVTFIGACTWKDDLQPPTMLWLLSLLLLPLGAIYFLLRFLADKPPVNVTLLCGYAAVLALAVVLCSTYFDRFVPMNAPRKTDLHVALLAMMLYLVTELRDLAGRSAPRSRAAFTILAFSLAFTVGASGLAAFAAGLYNNVAYLLQDLLLLGLAAYVATRALAHAKNEIPHEEETV